MIQVLNEDNTSVAIIIDDAEVVLTRVEAEALFVHLGHVLQDQDKANADD